MYRKAKGATWLVAPGAVATNIAETIDFSKIGPLANERIMSGMVLNPRNAEPKEIAGVALFLATEESSFINGAVITADGFHRQVLQRQQEFGLVGQKQIHVFAREPHHDVGVLEIRMRSLAFAHLKIQRKPSQFDHVIQKIFDVGPYFGDRIFFFRQNQFLPFLLEPALGVSTAGADMVLFRIHCCAIPTTLPVNQYSTSPADAK